MTLDSVRVSRLRKNFEQLIIGQKVKSWESSSFNFKIVLHLLLNLFKLLIVLLEFSEQVFAGAAVEDQRLLVSLDHGVLPKLVHNNELSIFLRQLLLNVLCTENVFQIHPLSLASQPLIDDFRNQHELLFQLFNLFSNFSHISRAHHGLNFKLMVIQSLHDVFHRANYELVLAFTIRIDYKVQLTPFPFNFLKLILNFFLACSSGRNLLHRIEFLTDSVLKKFIQFNF